MTPRLPTPEQVEADHPPSAEARDSATFLAVFALGGLSLALLFMVAMVLPQALYLALVVAAFGLYFGLHYVVWGRLMTTLTAEPEDEHPSASQPVAGRGDP